MVEKLEKNEGFSFRMWRVENLFLPKEEMIANYLVQSDLLDNYRERLATLSVSQLVEERNKQLDRSLALRSQWEDPDYGDEDHPPNPQRTRDLMFDALARAMIVDNKIDR